MLAAALRQAPRYSRPITSQVRHATGDFKLIVGTASAPDTTEPIHHALTNVFTGAIEKILETHKLIALTQKGETHIINARKKPFCDNHVRIFDQDGTLAPTIVEQSRLTKLHSASVGIEIKGCPGEHFYNVMNHGKWVVSDATKEQVLELVNNIIEPGTISAMGSTFPATYPGIIQAIKTTPGKNILLTKATPESMNEFLKQSQSKELFEQAIALKSQRKSFKLLELQTQYPGHQLVKYGETASDARSTFYFNQQKPPEESDAIFAAVTHPENASIYGPKNRPNEHLANMLTLALPKDPSKVNAEMPLVSPDIIVHNSKGLKNLYDTSKPVPTYNLLKNLVEASASYSPFVFAGAEKVLLELEKQFYDSGNPFL